MVIYIKENEIITENFYTEETKEELISLGFQAVTVPNVEEPSQYTYNMFKFVNNKWSLK
jgi:nitrogen regulatory protein PII